MCWSVQDTLLSSLLLLFFLLWNSPGRHIDILARCNLLSLLQRWANKRSCLCAKHFGQNANTAAQSPVWAAHSWWGLICVCVCVRALQYDWGLRTTTEEIQPLYSVPPWKTIHGESRGSWLFHFFHECSLSTHCLWRPELFILHKERNAKGYKDNPNGESSAWDTQTHPHTFTCQASPPTHTHAGMLT